MTPELEHGFKFWRYQFETWIPELAEEHHHDHPCDYSVFPLDPYVEEVYDRKLDRVWRRVVDAYKWRKFNADHSHRIIGRYNGEDEYSGFEGPQVDMGPIRILVRRHKDMRKWGYWVNRLWWSPVAYQREAFKGSWADNI